MQVRLARSLAKLALLCALGASVSARRARAQDDEPEAVPRGFAIPQTREARALAERAEAHLAAQRWGEAFTLLQELLTQHRGEVLLPPLIAHESDDVPREGAAVWASAKLASLPGEARALYASRYGEEARESLEIARRTRDARALLDVARRFPLTPSAADAWWALGDLEFEQGEQLAAQASWQRAEAVSRLFPQGTPQAAARRLALVRSLAVVECREPALPGAESVVWSQALARHDVLTPFSTGSSNCIFPTVADDTVLVTDTLRLWAFDAWSGEKRWESLEPAGWSAVDRGQYRPNGSRPLLRREFFENLHRRSLMVRPASAASVAVAALQIPYSSVYNDVYQNYEITNVIPERRLYAFDLRSGRELWNHRPPLDWNGSSGPLEFQLSVAAPPVISGSRVLVPYYRMQGRVDLHVGCFDLYSGERLWSSALMSGQMALNMFGRQLHEYNAAPVTIVGERVIVSTQLGSIAALDLQNGDIVWHALYEQIPVPRASHWEIVDRPQVFATASPAVAGGVVVCAPIDSYDFFALDLATGARLWTRPYSALRRPARELLALLGADRERVWFSGQCVVCVRAARGLAEAAPTELQESADVTNLSEWPRPLLTEKHVLVATPTRRVALLRNALASEVAEASCDWEAGLRNGNVARGDGALFYATSGALFGVIDWRAVEERFRLQSEQSPDDPQPLLDWAGVLERRALVEMERGRSLTALELLARAREKIERFATPADDALRAPALVRMYSLLLAEARALEFASEPLRALETLDRAAEFAPDDAAAVRVHVQRIDLCELLERHERRAILLAELGTIAADRDMPLDWWSLRGAARFAGSLSDSNTTGVLPVSLFVSLESARDARRRADASGEFRELHELLAAWGNVALPGDPAQAVSARIGELAESNRSEHQPYELRASELLAAARERSDAVALERVSVLFPHTSAALEAARLRLEQALETGDWPTLVRGVQRAIPDDWSPEVARDCELQALMVLRAALEELGNLPLAAALARRAALARPELASDLPRDEGRKLADLAQSLPQEPVVSPRPMSTELAQYDGKDTNAYLGMGQIALLGHFESPAIDGTRRWIQLQLQRTGRVEILQVVDALNPIVALWTQTLEPGTVRPTTRAALAAGMLVLGGTTQLTGLDPLSGAVRWRWNSGGDRIEHHASLGGLVLASTRAADGRASLVAVEPRSGIALWERAVPAGLWAHRPVLGPDHLVLLPSDWAQTPAVVLDPYTGSRTRIFRLPAHVSEADAAGAWIDSGRLFLPSFPKSSSPLERDCLTAWQLDSGARAWRVPCEDDVEFDSIVRSGDQLYLVYLATGKSKGAIVAVNPRIGAARRIAGLEFDADDVLVGVRRHAVVESESGMLFVRSPSADGQLSELIACQLPFGRKWVHRLPVHPSSLYNSGPMPLPLVLENAVVVAYTETPRVRGQVSVPRTLFLLLDREGGAVRETMQLPMELGPAEVLDFESFGPNLWVAGQGGVLRRTKR
ncbi:MAG: hypothetical protein FJ298_11740 [Planctomycetes bacterium]|nr:hypothetical protein [Planctomycetota bacterium]